MKNMLDIFELLEINTNLKKPIQITHCLQIPSNNMFETNIGAKKDAKYVFLGTHGKLDKILQICKDGSTQFMLGHWNDGVI